MRSSNEAPNVKLSTVATFPKNYFLENLAVRSDNSVLLTVLNHKELWYVPSSDDEQPVEPELLFTFPQPAMGIVEVEPDVFHISASDIYVERILPLSSRFECLEAWPGSSSRVGSSLSSASPRTKRKLRHSSRHHFACGFVGRTHLARGPARR